MLASTLRRTIAQRGLAWRAFSCSSSARSSDSGAAQGLSLLLSEEQKEFQALARKFAKEEMMPMERHHDQTMEFPKAIFNKAWELGLCNTHIPQVSNFMIG